MSAPLDKTIRLFVCVAVWLLGSEPVRSQAPASSNAVPNAVPSVAVAAAPGAGVRMVSVGHSFHVFMPNILREMAAAAGIQGHVQAGLSSIGASRVIQHWNVAEGKSKAKEVLSAGQADVLTLAPIFLPDEGIENFAKLAHEKNPAIRVTVQEFWLPHDWYEPPNMQANPKGGDHNSVTVAELRERHNAYFRAMDEHVKELNAKLGANVCFVVPVGQAVLALREKVIRGEAPGVRDQNDLFTDAIGHPKPVIQVLASYCHYAVTYRTSPVGLKAPSQLGGEKADVALVKMLQQLAWQAVTEHPLSGISAK